VKNWVKDNKMRRDNIRPKFKVIGSQPKGRDFKGRDDTIKVSSDEIGQGRTEVNEREKLGQGREDGEEVTYDIGSRSRGDNLKVDHDDNIKVTSEEIGQGRTEVSKREEFSQGRQDGGEITYEKGSRSKGHQLENYVSLDTRGDFELFWDVDSVAETIQFQLVANVNKDDLLAFGFSDYGDPEDADLCVMWTNLHGRHLFQVSQTCGYTFPSQRCVVG